MRVDWKPPKSYKAEEWTHVRIPHKDHPELLDAYVSTTENPKAWVVMTHPFLKKAKGWMMDYGSYKTYTEKGIGVLMLDFNGFGGSEDIGFDFKDDVLSASIWLQRHHPNLPQLLHGVSFGAGHGLVALENAQHTFRGAILENPFPSITHFYKNKPVLYAFLRFMMLFFPWEKQNRPIGSASRTKNMQEILWIFGERDTMVGEIERSDFLNKTNVKARTWLADAKHNEAYKSCPKHYDMVIGEYLEDIGVLTQRIVVESD